MLYFISCFSDVEKMDEHVDVMSIAILDDDVMILFLFWSSCFTITCGKKGFGWTVSTSAGEVLNNVCQENYLTNSNFKSVQ